jgi:hypothetical protein
MPNYDWIDTQDFQNAVRQRLSERLETAGMTGMPFTFTATLVQLAKENRPILESRTPPPDPRGRALDSVDEIVSTAMSLARTDGRREVTERDIEGAIQARFCHVFPFCR